jgi:hypothetical protein
MRVMTGGKGKGDDSTGEFVMLHQKQQQQPQKDEGSSCATAVKASVSFSDGASVVLEGCQQQSEDAPVIGISSARLSAALKKLFNHTAAKRRGCVTRLNRKKQKTKGEEESKQTDER